MGININNYAQIGVKAYRSAEKANGRQFRDENEGFVTIMLKFRMPLVKEIVSNYPEFAPVYQMIAKNMDTISKSEDPQQFSDFWGDETMEIAKYQNTLGAVPEFAILYAMQISIMCVGVDPEIAQAATNVMMQAEQAMDNNLTDEYTLQTHAILCVALWYSDYKNYKSIFKHRLAERIITDGEATEPTARTDIGRLSVSDSEPKWFKDIPGKHVVSARSPERKTTAAQPKATPQPTVTPKPNAAPQAKATPQPEPQPKTTSKTDPAIEQAVSKYRDRLRFRVYTLGSLAVLIIVGMLASLLLSRRHPIIFIIVFLVLLLVCSELSLIGILPLLKHNKTYYNRIKNGVPLAWFITSFIEPALIDPKVEKKKADLQRLNQSSGR